VRSGGTPSVVGESAGPILGAMGVARRHRSRMSIAVLVLTVVAMACDATPAGTPVGPTASIGDAADASGPVASSTDAGQSGVPSLAPTTTATEGVSTGGSAGGPGLPDPKLTPGARNPDVTPADLGSTICKSGWTKTVRPPVSYTNALKRKQIAQYGYADTRLSQYEEDHLIPLEVGGAPRDPRNLWPEPRTATLPDGKKVGATQKDGLENYLHARVCNGAIALAAAQDAFADDWVAAWEAAGRP
jgi:hypothetical protein